MLAFFIQLLCNVASRSQKLTLFPNTLTTKLFVQGADHLANSLSEMTTSTPGVRFLLDSGTSRTLKTANFWIVEKRALIPYSVRR